MKVVKVENGNKLIDISIIDTESWAKGDCERIYFTLSQSQRRDVVGCLYEIVAGTTTDKTFEVSGKTYGYTWGLSSDSSRKRDHTLAAMKELVAD
jgi:hypothetical protein